MTGFESKRQAAQAKMDDDDDTQVYADTLTIVYQRGFADGKRSAEQQAEPTQWRDMVVVSLVREGIDKHKARQLADHFAAQPTQQAKMRMPKVGDKVICLEDESLGEVVSLTAGGSPDIKFDDGSRGTYMLREFAELFGYAEQRQQQAEPVAWMTINEYNEEDDIHYENPEGHLLEGWTYKPLYTHPPTVQPEEEPLEYWNAVEGWIKIAEVREHFGAVGCGTIYKTAGEDRVPLYTSPPQRPWVGLEIEEVQDSYNSDYQAQTRAVEKLLKERNT